MCDAAHGERVNPRVAHGASRLASQWRAVARFVLSQFFGNLSQEAGREDVDGGTGVFIDEMTMQHLMVLGDNIMLFNRVKVLEKEKKPGPPCPYCGELLRTPKAKQCRACGMDWHDPEHIVRNRKTMPAEGCGQARGER
jgi:hypothetical protein